MTLSEEIYRAVSVDGPSCLLTEGREYSPHQLITRLLHPRGIEHAIATGYPTLELLQRGRASLEGEPVTLLDDSPKAREPIDLTGGTHLFAGAGDAFISISGIDHGATTLVALHGARLFVTARDHAVVTTHQDASSYIIVSTDSTAYADR